MAGPAPAAAPAPGPAARPGPAAWPTPAAGPAPFEFFELLFSLKVNDSSWEVDGWSLHSRWPHQSQSPLMRYFVKRPISTDESFSLVLTVHCRLFCSGRTDGGRWIPESWQCCRGGDWGSIGAWWGTALGGSTRGPAVQPAVIHRLFIVSDEEALCVVKDSSKVS